MSRLPILTDSHFTEKEMACPCCGQMIIDPEFLFRLEALRRILDIPLVVTSGFRCKKWNTKKKGHPNSMHMQGKAVDISVNSKKEYWKIEDKATRIGFTGIGIYPKHIHLDMRPGEGATVFNGKYN